MKETGQGGRIEVEFPEEREVGWDGKKWKRGFIFQQEGTIELKRRREDGEEESRIVPILDLRIYNSSPDTTTADPADPNRGAVLSRTRGTPVVEAIGEVGSKVSPADAPGLSPKQIEADVEDQYKGIIGHFDRVVSNFVLTHNRHPDRQEAIALFKVFQAVLENINFLRKEFLDPYFRANDETRLLRTGKFFTFKTEDELAKTDNKFATFELCVAKIGRGGKSDFRFELRAQKDTVDGSLAQKIMDADNSGRIEA